MASYRLAGIWVDVEAREVRAADVEPHTVTSREQVTGRCEVDVYCIDLFRFQKFLVLPTRVVATTNDAVAQIHMVTVGIIGIGWMYVDQLDREVGIACRRGDS